MSSRAVSLGLVLAVILGGMALVVYDHREEREIERETTLVQLAQQARHDLEMMRHLVTPDLALETLWTGFAGEVTPALQTGTANEQRRFVLHTYLRIGRLLPRHDVALVVPPFVGSASLLLFRSAGLGLRPPTALAFAAFMDARYGGRTASPPAAAVADLARLMTAPISGAFLNELFARYAATLQMFHSIEGSRAAFWQPLRARDGRFVGVLLAVTDTGNLRADYPLAATARAPHRRAVGAAFVPRRAQATAHLGGWCRTHPALRAALSAAHTGERRLPEHWTASDYVAFTGPTNAAQPTTAVIVYRWPQGRDPHERRTDSGVVILALAGGALAVLLTVQHIILQRGPRIGVGLSLLLALLLAAVLPIMAARILTRRALAQFAGDLRARAATDLHQSLSRTDDGARFQQAGIIDRLRRLTSEPWVTGGLLAEEQRSLALRQGHGGAVTPVTTAPVPNEMRYAAGAGRIGSGTLPRLASDVVIDLAIDPVLAAGNEFLAGARASLNVISVVGPQDFLDCWTKARDLPEEIRAGRAISGGSMLAGVFGGVRRAMLARAESHRTPTKMDAGKIAAEAKMDFLLEAIRQALGGPAVLNLVHHPGRISEFTNRADRYFFTQTGVKIDRLTRYVLTWVWKEVIVDRPFLANELRKHRMTRHDLQWYAWSQPSEDSLPGGIREDTELYDLAQKARHTGITFQAQDLTATDQPVLAALPTRHLNDFVLVGRRSMAAELTAIARWQWLANIGLWATVLLALLAAALSGAWFLSPLTELRAAVAAVSAQRYDVRVADHRADEFGSLARTFNSMADDLQEGRLLGRFVSDSVRQVVTDESSRRAAEQGEIREATVVFSSIAGFDTELEGNDRTRLFALLERHLVVAHEATARLGGTIEKMIGDKILIVFDHDRLGGATTAVHTALAVITAMRSRWRQHVATTELAMGVNSGPVLAGILGAANVRLDYTVIGDSVNLAARLATLAHTVAGTQVVLSGRTVDLAGPGITTQRLPFRHVKGKTQQVEAHLLIA